MTDSQINNRFTFKRPDGLIYTGHTWESKEAVKKSLCEGRWKLWWILLYLQGWRVINE